MILVKAIVAAVLATLVFFFVALIVVVPLASNTAGAAAAIGVLAVDPSEEAITDIPAILLGLYIESAQACPGLPWSVIAGIGKVESNHGRFGGAAIGPDGRVTPEIIGIRLDGTQGTAVIRDTDNGRLDGDTEYDRAVGPFQFIPSSWAIFGVDGNGDGVADPHNIYDAVPAAVRHLCPEGQITDIEAAIFAYNHSYDYVDAVLGWSARYTGAVSAVPVAGYALPLSTITEAQAMRPHHDYAALDLAVALEAPAFAMVDGVVDVSIGDAGIYHPGKGPRRHRVVIVGVVRGL